MKISLPVISTFLISLTAFGSHIDSFSEQLTQNYREGRCYDNSLALIQDFVRSDKTDKFVLVKLENKGSSTFGLVNAEKARSKHLDRLVAEEKNWYEHWFVMDENNIVYDFDFTTRPTPTKFQDYVEQMFLLESECQTPSWTELCGGRETKLTEYQVSVFDGKAIAEGSKTQLWTGSLKEAFAIFPDLE